MKNIYHFLKDESGQGLVEYGLIIALIVVASIGALTTVGITIRKSLYDEIVERLKEIVKSF